MKKRYFILIFSFLSVAVIVAVSAALYEGNFQNWKNSIFLLFLKCCVLLGDACNLLDGKSGMCMSIYNCSSATKELEKGDTSKLCGYENNASIVCCKNSSSTESSPRISAKSE